ncbi:MAG: hypothetical protein KF902_02990 [Phycisphaeraceae bacterium]|nr:hypothetical protein [Phycisphaeraceae bacterium]
MTVPTTQQSGKAIATNLRDEIHVTKLDVATQQLCSAIRLLFEGPEHIVAVHTLASASAAVFRDILKHNGDGSVLRDKAVRPEKHDFWNRRLNESANFFKHADRDPSAKTRLRTVATHFQLIDAIDMNARTSQPVTIEMWVYILWTCQIYPEIWQECELKARLNASIDAGDFDLSDHDSVRGWLRDHEFCEYMSRNPLGLFHP